MIETAIKAALLFPFIFFVPGCLTYITFIKKKIELEFFEIIFIQILTSILISGWIGLFLAVLGYFSFLNLLLVLLFFSLILVISNLKAIRNISRRSLCNLRPKKDSKFVMLIAILIIATLLFFPPGENITYNHDDTPIVNHGINIARTGKLIGYDPIFIEVANNGNSDAFYSMWPSGLGGVQFPYFGFWVNLITENTTFQYFDFYPLLLAIFYSALGFRLFLYLTPIIALLSISSVFLTTRYLFNWKVGVLSAFLLTINFSQIWFARYPGAEMLTQLLFFSGVYSIALMLKFREPFFAFLSSLMFGTLMLVRIDALFITCSIALFIILLQLFYNNEIRKCLRIFSITFVSLNLWTILHIWLFDKNYMYGQFPFIPKYQYLLQPVSEHMITRVELALIIYGLPSLMLIFNSLILTRIRKRRKSLQYVPYVNHRSLRLLVVALIALSFMVLYIDTYPFSTSIIGKHQTLLILEWFLSPAGLMLSIFGMVLIINDKILKPKVLTDKRLLPILCIVMIAISNIYIFIFLGLRNQPVFPWGFRRYISVIFPFFIVCISYSIFRINSLIRRLNIFGKKKVSENLSKIVSIGLILILMISMISMNLDSGILTHREFDGLIGQTEDFASYFDQESIIILWPVHEVTGIAVPLKYNFDKNAILLPTYEVGQHFLNQVELWKNNGRRVYKASLYPPRLEGTVLPENFSYVPYINFQIEFPKRGYVGTKRMGPPIGSKPYGEIRQIEQTLYVNEIELSINVIDFMKLEPKLVNTTMGSAFWSINGIFKEVLFEIPSSNEKSYIWYEDIELHRKPSLKYSIALSSEAWKKEGDGVLFEIYVDEDIVFSKYIDPKNNASDRKWHNFGIDLSEYAGKTVRIGFVTSAGPNNNAEYDYAAWGDPILVNYQ